MKTIDIMKQAKEVSQMLTLTTEQKNRALQEMANALRTNTDSILKANQKDVQQAKDTLSKVKLDRLILNEERIESMAKGIEEVIELKDPVNQILEEVNRNGLCIQKKSVPLGVIAIIYESRPNVTSDAASLAIKSGNVCILRTGKEAYNSAKAIVDALQEGLEKANIQKEVIQLIDDITRNSAYELMNGVGYIDLLIPRGGAGLIRTVVENSTVPVIETGTGNCHVYVDVSADIDMAVKIILNAKTQRTGVCNACESLVIHKDIIGEALPAIAKALREKHCELRGDEAALEVVPDMKKATEEDWGTEYLDLIASVRTVASVDEAIEHINRYNTGHSEAIVTKDYANARKFLDEVDAAAVYVNASTRFTDGFEFGFGAEIGISTQKLHARGPMGLKELTTTKYVIYGDGQIRE